MNTTRTVILHMTDLHFGCDGENPNSLNSRQLALDGLARAITDLDPAWRPTIVVVTGDLAWRGKKPDYDKFGAWFGELLKALGLAPDRCFFCTKAPLSLAGNTAVCSANLRCGIFGLFARQALRNWSRLSNR
jgi:hypothetical protein